MSTQTTKGAQDQNAKGGDGKTRSSVSRRAFLKGAGGIATTSAALAVIGIEPLLGTSASQARGADIWRPEAQEGTELRLKPPEGTHAPLKHLRKRRSTAYALRVERARHWRHFHFQPPLANDDEVKYPDGWANFSKSLPHDHLGHPDPAAFEALVYACRTGRPMDFAAIAGSDD